MSNFPVSNSDFVVACNTKTYYWQRLVFFLKQGKEIKFNHGARGRLDVSLLEFYYKLFWILIHKYEEIEDLADKY